MKIWRSEDKTDSITLTIENENDFRIDICVVSNFN